MSPTILLQRDSQLVRFEVFAVAQPLALIPLQLQSDGTLARLGIGGFFHLPQSVLVGVRIFHASNYWRNGAKRHLQICGMIVISYDHPTKEVLASLLERA